MEIPTAHALLRDRSDWLGQRHGLALDRDGNLTLARIPAASGKPVNIAASYPYPRQVSGIAVGPCNSVFVTDTEGDRILYVDGLCAAQVWFGSAGVGASDLPGHFKSPRGLALGADALSVADSGNARVQSLALPRLEASLSYSLWGEPTSIAVDSRGRLLVVDAATGTLHRLNLDRTADAAFDVKIAAQAKLQQSLFVTCGTDDSVLVSDQSADQVFVFDSTGGFVGILAGPAGWQPGAIAAFGDRVYVADAASGAIVVFDAGVSTAQLGTWRGPVTALAVNETGDLFIKPGLDAAYYRFAVDTDYVAAGALAAGPFDAGEDREWERAWADVSLPPGTSLTISVAVQAASTPPPAASDWVTLPSLDALLALSTVSNRRFVWLKLELASASAQASPTLAQARVATAAENLLDYLPLTYGLHDGPGGFLTRWLELVRGEFGRIEELLDDMPRVCDPRFTSASALPWLAQWLSLELPQIADDGQRRALIERAVHLMARRGTPGSIAEFVELHTGIRPAIVEAFNDRPIWILGTGSQLGFDTRLPPLDPFGMVVADERAGNGCCPPLDPAGQTPAGCAPCNGTATAASSATSLGDGPVGRAIVGEGGPLAVYQVGLPLFSEEAYRFCVVVDAYRAHDPATRAEIARIVEREKPAHTDYRIELIAPEFRIGLQASVGVDAIVGGDPPALRLDPARLGYDTRLPPSDVARFGEATLDGLLTLN
jgi:phage tail-like protein